MGSGKAAQIRVARERREAGVVARLTVDNQAKLNVLDSRLTEALRRAVEGLAAEAEAEAELRAVVLTGAGARAFIGGADIRELAALTPAMARRFITGLHELCAALQALPVPVIARIRVFCLGAGLEIAAACDLRAAAEDARFAMPEVRVGIPSVIEAALLPRLVGMGRARELVLTGAAIGATEALAIGLVERVVPAARQGAAVDAWRAAIHAAGPRALALQKKLLREWQELPLDEAIAKSIDAFAQAYESDEPARLMRAFLERPR